MHTSFLTKGDSRTGRLWDRGLAYTGRAQRSPYKKKNNVPLMPCPVQASNKIFITRLQLPEGLQENLAGSFGTVPGAILGENWTGNGREENPRTRRKTCKVRGMFDCNRNGTENAIFLGNYFSKLHSHSAVSPPGKKFCFFVQISNLTI